MDKKHQEMIKGIEKQMKIAIGEDTFNEFMQEMGAKSLCDAVENYSIHEKNDPIREGNSPTKGYTEAGMIKSALRISKVLFPKPRYNIRV